MSGRLRRMFKPFDGRRDKLFLAIGVTVYGAASVPYFIVMLIADSYQGITLLILPPLTLIGLPMMLVPVAYSMAVLNGTPISGVSLALSAVKVYWRGFLGVVLFTSGIVIGLILTSFIRN